MYTRLASTVLAGISLAGDACVPLAAQEVHGVFVGINDYIAYEDEAGGDLQGAESDALLMKAVLVDHWGLAEENTLTLLSRAATKEAIREALTGWLADRTGPEDLAVFYFAGHGAQAYDLDGDEPDGLDETLAPTDILPLSSEKDIRDDELKAWLATIGTDVVVILDSCHSGTATRSSGMRTRSLERPLPPEGGNEPEQIRQRPDPQSMADGSTTILELAAAAPNRSALEGPFGESKDGVQEQRGAFTYFLVQQLQTASPETTYEDLLQAVVAALEANDFLQGPQLTGSGKNVLFSKGR
jgi:hypothetical protein